MIKVPREHAGKLLALIIVWATSPARHWTR